MQHLDLWVACMGDKLLIDLEGGKDLEPFRSFGLLSHTCPYIGVEHISPHHAIKIVGNCHIGIGLLD